MKELTSEKYRDIVNTAHKQFWKHGIKRVSVEEICREAEVSKMTFYKFFSNKKEIAIVVIDRILDDSIQQFRDLMNEDISFEQKVKKMLLAKFEGTKEISQELVKDIYTDEKTGVREHWQKRADEFSKEVFNAFAYAQQQGWMRKDIKLEFIMYFNAKVAEMISDPKLVALYDNMQDLIMEVANFFFYGVFSQNSERK